jgi:hypothetical protein
VLRPLEEDYESLRSWPSDDSLGGRFTFAGSHDKWKLSFHLIQMEELVASVVTIGKRRTNKRVYRAKD